MDKRKTSGNTINSYFYASYVTDTTAFARITFSKNDVALDVVTIPILTDVENLTHEQIFNLLTNNGTVKGIYKEDNQLYISFTYAKGGQLTLGGASDGNGKLVIQNTSGEQIGYIDSTGVYFEQGTFSGTVSGATIKGSRFETEDASGNKIVIYGSTQTFYAPADYDTYAGTIKPVVGNTSIEQDDLIVDVEVAGMRFDANYLMQFYVNGSKAIEIDRGRINCYFPLYAKGGFYQ